MKRRHGKCIFRLDPKEWWNKIKYSINLKHKRGVYHLCLHARERERVDVGTKREKPINEKI